MKIQRRLVPTFGSGRFPVENTGRPAKHVSMVYDFFYRVNLTAGAITVTYKSTLNVEYVERAQMQMPQRLMPERALIIL